MTYKLDFAKSSTEIRGYRYLTPEETVIALNGDYIDGKILFEGTWMNVYRTDVCDDVTTGGSGDIESYRIKANNCYGARIDDNMFCVIDRFTDG
jgi:hypothetical protein